MNNLTESTWQELHRDLSHFISKRGIDPDATDDILQDVFLKIHLRADTLRDEQKLVAWAYQITRNAIADYYRMPQRNVELSETLADDKEDNDDDDLARDFVPCIRPLLDSLPTKYREVLLLTEYQGLSLQAAADQLRLSFSGVKSRVQRARDLLKGILLQCCHFEFDRRGHMIDYYPYRVECAGDQSQTSCRSDSCA
jgi:RNA polymerase sigma-70 factor (ECF subfamily)